METKTDEEGVETTEENTETQRKEKELEEEYDLKLQEAELKTRQAEEARIRAEAERDAFQKAITQTQTTGQTPQWTDDQWASFQERTGVTKEGLVEIAQMTQAQLGQVSQKFETQLRQAEEKAKQAEEKLGKLEKIRTVDQTKADYFAKKPALARHQAIVDEFLADYPDEVKSNPEQLKKLLSKAEVYVKGKIGETAMKNLTKGQGVSFEKTGSEITEPAETTEVDLSGLTEAETRIIKGAVRTSEEYKKLEPLEADCKLGPGVALKGKFEWEAVRQANIKQFGHP